MPGGDRTGPAGFGPMTGRGMGYCAGYAAPGFANPAFGRGFGRGGGGFGWRNRYWATGVPGWAAFGGTATAAPFASPTAEQEVEILKGQAENMSGALEDIKARIAQLEAEKTDK